MKLAKAENEVSGQRLAKKKQAHYKRWIVSTESSCGYVKHSELSIGCLRQRVHCLSSLKCFKLKRFVDKHYISKYPPVAHQHYFRSVYFK